MDRKQMCVANIQYKKPTANEAKRAQGLLRYLTYRDRRDKRHGMQLVGNAGKIMVWVGQ